MIETLSGQANKHQQVMAELVMAGRSVLVLQDDIKGIEPSADILLSNSDNTSVGSLTRNAEDVPVYALDDNLEFQGRFPDFHPVCVFMEEGDKSVGVLCERVRLNAASTDSVQGIPGIMQAKDGLIEALAIVAESVVSVSSAHKIIEHIERTHQFSAG